MPAIFYLFNVMNAKKKWKVPAVKTVWILFICLLKNKRNAAAELTKAVMFLINQRRGGLADGCSQGISFSQLSGKPNVVCWSIVQNQLI